MNEEQVLQVKSLLLEFQSIFGDSKISIGRTSLIQHKIDTGEAKPIKQRPQPVPIHHREELDKAMRELIEKDLIEPSSSPRCAPIVLVKKGWFIKDLCGLQATKCCLKKGTLIRHL